MKRVAITFFIFIFFLPIISVYAAETEKRFSIQANPLYIISDVIYPFLDNEEQTNYFTMNLEAQYSLNKRFFLSLNNNVSYENYLTSYYQDNSGRFNKNFAQQFQYIAEPEFVYNLSGSCLQGFYVGVAPRIGFAHVSSSNIDDTFLILGCGVISGYQWITKHGFTIQLGAGIGKSWIIPFGNNVSVYDQRNEWYLFNLPFDIPLKLQIGYSF